MKSFITITVLLLAFTLAGCSGLSQKFDQFKTYTINYQKRYQSRLVEFYRFAIYIKNMAEIELLNADPQDNAIYGETRFTDRTKSEMKALAGLKPPADFQFNFVQNYTNATNYKPKQGVPDIWNWQQQGALTSVKDQGTCGSCWTFSTVGNIQSLNFLKTKRMVEYSEQQLIDCDKVNQGCAGGWPYKAIDFLAKHDGLMSLQDYPLRKNYTGPCQFNSQKQRVQVKGYMNVTQNETIIKDALYELGPLSILLDFTGMFHYKSGVANPRLCGSWPDHALVLAGYGIEKEDYWLVKNSWGPKWGINGFLMLKRGSNKCGVYKWATTAVLEDE